MKLIDTFCVSEPHEKTLLYLKLLHEYSRVDHFVICECAWTFQGEEKGLHLRQMLADPIFEPFKSKIIVVSSSERLWTGPNNEANNFQAEHLQRQMAYSAIADIVSRDDRVIVSDVDEMFDFTNHKRKTDTERLLQATAGERLIFVGRRRYWFDFDNLCPHEGMSIPIFTVDRQFNQGYLRCRTSMIDRIHHPGMEPDVLAFEFSFCFSRDAIWRKLNTFSHPWYRPDELDVALKCNHWPMCEARQEKFVDFQPQYWFEKIALNYNNSTHPVISMLPQIQTGVVDESYTQNRIAHYPQFFTTGGGRVCK